MNSSEFQRALFSQLSCEGFVQSYKTQLRLALHKFSVSNQNISFPSYQHTLRSEIICNIIAEYLKAYGFNDSLSVFREESAFHKLSREDILHNVDLPETSDTILESLMKRKRRKGGTRSIATQSNSQSLQDRLDSIDYEVKLRRASQKAVDRQRLVNERLKRIREERESQLEERIRHAYEAQRTIELSRAKIEINEKYRTEIARMKDEFDAQLLQREQELRIARDHEEEAARLMQEELDRQLERVRNGTFNQKDSKIDPKEVKAQCNRQLNKMMKRARKIAAQRNAIREQIEFEKEAQARTNEELITLRQQFAAIK